jgi:anaerobic magnesium-protoporphyrin IX monomethyl ester cyclase
MHNILILEKNNKKMDVKKILLINPSLYEVYEDAKVKGAVPHYPPLNLLTVAGSLIREGYNVELLDFDLLGMKEQGKKVLEKLKEYNPDLVGVTCGSPTFNQVKGFVKVVKEFNKNILVVAGGSHPSADPEGALKESEIDIVICGEGDYTILDILKAYDSNDFSAILGIGFKNGNEVVITAKRDFIQNLDDLAMPAFELVNIHEYYVPPSFCRESPAMTIETSRGCAWGCTYCTKAVFGRNFRYKSPQRVVDEFKKMAEIGYKEIHVTDDMFTTSKERVKEICRLLTEQNVKITWACPNGIRADRTDEELIQLMYNAGCYRVSFGVESGNQQVLNNIDKQQTLEQTKNAFKICNKVGMETHAYLILGLPGETEETMLQTIELAKEIKPTIAKFDILIPLPSTPLFHEWKDKYFKVKDWDDFNYHNAKELYTHPNLSWEVLDKYYNKAFRSFYFRPSYLIRRFFTSLRNGTLLIDLKLAFGTKWF